MPVAALALAPMAVSAGVGLFQTLFSGRRKAQKKLDSFADNAPQYAGNRGINDYYQEAYNRYLTSPENSALYQNSINSINRNSANTLNALQDRRGALDAVGQLSASQNAASNNAMINAENQRNQRFGILGQATQMKSADDMQKFNTNTIMPYQTKLGLLATKASNKNQQFNQGLSNIFNAAGSASMYFGSGATMGGGGNSNNGSYTQYYNGNTPNSQYSPYQTPY